MATLLVKGQEAGAGQHATGGQCTQGEGWVVAGEGVNDRLCTRGKQGGC